MWDCHLFFSTIILVSKSPPDNQLEKSTTENVGDYHLFFSISFWSVNHRWIINSKKITTECNKMFCEHIYTQPRIHTHHHHHHPQTPCICIVTVPISRSSLKGCRTLLNHILWCHIEILPEFIMAFIEHIYYQQPIIIYNLPPCSYP